MKKREFGSRTLALLLTLIMFCGLLPMSAFAEGTPTGDTSITSVYQDSMKPVQKITVNSDSDTVETGKTLQMKADVEPTDASEKSVSWSVKNGTGSADIDEESGLLTGSNSGTVTITATANDGTLVTGEKEITVTQAEGTIVIDEKTSAGGDGWTWDKDSKTLTLAGIDLQTGDAPCISINVPDTVYINLKEGTTSKLKSKVGINNETQSGKTIIQGKGVLEIEALSTGIFCKGSLTIKENPAIKINGDLGSKPSLGIRTRDGITVDGGKIDINNFGGSIFIEGTAAFNGGTTTIKNEGTGSMAVYVSGTLTVSDTLQYWGWDGKDFVPDRLEIYKADRQVTFIEKTTGNMAKDVKIFGAAPTEHTVTVESAHGKVTATPDSAAKDTEITLSVNEVDPGYKLAGWTTDPEGIKIEENKFKMPDSDVKVTAVFEAVKVSGIAVNSESNSVITGKTLQMKADVTPANAADKSVTWSTKNGTGSADIDAATGLLTAKDPGTVTVTATAKDGSGVTGTKEITVTKPVPSEYTITVNNDGNGSASADATKAEAGTVVKLSEKANTGYQFKEWQVEAGGVKIENNQFTMPEGNISIKAVFEKTPTPVPSEYTITVNNDGKGTASADVTKAKAGTVVKLSQKANKGYQFKEWKVEAGTVTIKDNQFTMPEGNVVIKAVFEKTVAPTPTPSPSPSPTTQKTETKTNVSTGIISNETGVYSAVVLLSVAGLMALVIKRKMKG